MFTNNEDMKSDVIRGNNGPHYNLIQNGFQIMEEVENE